MTHRYLGSDVQAGMSTARAPRAHEFDISGACSDLTHIGLCPRQRILLILTV